MRTHRLDFVSLVFGLVFVGLAIVGLVDAVWLTMPDLRLLGPAVLVLAGLALVITAARGRSNERGANDPDGGQPLDRHNGEALSEAGTEVVTDDPDR